MRFVAWPEVVDCFNGKTVAIVGSGPSSLDNAPGLVDSFDVVCRVSDYKTGANQGYRCDIHYSFYGNSIRKPANELEADGCKLCICKLPNSKPLKSEWHERRNKQVGIDYRYIYEKRESWWFCDVFIPDDARFLRKFELLGKHQPTTGFSGVLDVLDCKPASLYMTGYDFFSSKLRNIDEAWKPGDPTDPIRHRPDLEAQWLAENQHDYPLTFDPKLRSMMDYMQPA